MQKPWSEWDVAQWLHNLEHRNTQEIQLGLTRILEVAKTLEVSTPVCKVLTVGGTNGKGSTVRALETIYHTSGYKVGSYTSPHLIHFNERIRVNLNPVSDLDLCRLFTRIEETRGSVQLTYFEFVTLAALLYFKEQSLDLIILEVGLGGRLDATNIINADLSIITTIDYDHQEYLGTTLEAIGYEKAGILRQNKPFIYADSKPPFSILKIAKDLAVPSYLLGKHYEIQEYDDRWNLSIGHKTINDLPKPQIQIKSAAAAIVACTLLQSDLPVSEEQLKSAMLKIFIPGRLQLVKGRVDILFDVAHNAQSARLLADTIKKMSGSRKIHAVFSALKDKDLFGLISPLKDCVAYWYPAQLDNKRASTTEIMLSLFEEAEIFVEICYTNPLSAFQTALSQAKDGDLIVVYGSFFTVGQIMTVQHNILEQEEII